jgi:hypothetical protein
MLTEEEKSVLTEDEYAIYDDASTNPEIYISTTGSKPNACTIIQDLARERIENKKFESLIPLMIEISERCGNVSDPTWNPEYTFHITISIAEARKIFEAISEAEKEL